MSTKSRAHSIIGDSNNRALYDEYETPEYITRELLKVEDFHGLTWEPACGGGKMSRVLERKLTDHVMSSDIQENNHIYGTKGIDFLSYDYDIPIVNNIITNPPFKYALGFVLRSKEIATDKIAMFCKLPFLEGINRYRMFMDKVFPLKKILMFSHRPTLVKYGASSEGVVGMISYAWFIWDRTSYGRVNKPVIEWTDAKYER